MGARGKIEGRRMIRRRSRAADPARRQYPPDALSLYAAYAPVRADYAPSACDGGRQCWVRDGPPSLSGNRGGNHRCLGCGGAPRARVVSHREPR